MKQAYLRHFNKLTIWKRNDERAPHKPLLALWAIGRCLQGEDRLAEYDVVHSALLPLLNAFGPARRSHKPQEPFWRLQKDHIWEIPEANRLVADSRGGVSPVRLRELHTMGGFPQTLFDLFRKDPTIALHVARQLVDAHFPETMRMAVLEATLGESVIHHVQSRVDDIDSDQSPLLNSALSRRARNSTFRKTILPKYSYRCAVCQFSFEFPMGNRPALEAAHIKWHSHRGPDEVPNGLSLCVLHHELFDWGAFTILPETLHIVIATEILERGLDDWLVGFHGMQLPVKPEKHSDWPAADYLHWHARNVFKDPAFRSRQQRTDQSISNTF